jgi:hypothetical protein
VVLVHTQKSKRTELIYNFFKVVIWAEWRDGMRLSEQFLPVKTREYPFMVMIYINFLFFEYIRNDYKVDVKNKNAIGKVKPKSKPKKATLKLKKVILK